MGQITMDEQLGRVKTQKTHLRRTATCTSCSSFRHVDQSCWLWCDLRAHLSWLKSRWYGQTWTSTQHSNRATSKTADRPIFGNTEAIVQLCCNYRWTSERASEVEVKLANVSARLRSNQSSYCHREVHLCVCLWFALAKDRQTMLFNDKRGGSLTNLWTSKAR